MNLRKTANSFNAPARLGLVALAVATLTLSACAYHDHGRHRGHHRSHGEVELELEFRDHDRDVCCKRGRRDWWTESRRECRRHGGRIVSHRYCRRD